MSNQILREMLDNVPDNYQKTIGFPVYDILAAVALRLKESQTVIDRSRDKLDPERLHGMDLDAYIFPRSGLARKDATFASGKLEVTGNGTVMRGALFESSGGVQFYAVDQTEIEKNGIIQVTCKQDGSVGNVPAHTITQIPVTIQGISACTNPAPMTGGYPEEDDQAYFERFLIHLRTPPTSGNIYHYMMWALEVSGVGQVHVTPLGHGANTVDVAIVDSSGKPADPGLVSRVQDYIDPGSTGEGRGQAPIGARCYVSAAISAPLSLRVRVRKKKEELEETVTQNIKDAVTKYLGRAAFRSAYISYAQVADAILDAPGVLDYDALSINGGTDHVTLRQNEVAVLGDVVITYAD